MEKCMIVAVADNLAIGVKGELPWHISEDLKYFRRQTTGCPVIMGRTTYESIGRPLPGRKNIVLTSRPGLPETVCAVSSPQQAFLAAEPAERCFVIGGARLYAQLIGEVDKLYLTRVHTLVPDADAFFPPVDPAVWKEESCSETKRDEESGLEYEFVVYSRK
ncbi:MAG: dihydrofolate reductase [Bacteroidales bacterium]|nr:dihydrofolate reductase [Bacteroidales bacterium]